MPRLKTELKPEGEDDQFMSLSQVTKMMQQQKDVFMALLQQQQDNVKGFVHLILDSTKSRIETIMKDVQEVQVSLQFTQKEADDLKVSNSKQTEKGATMQADIFRVCDSLVTMTDKM